MLKIATFTKCHQKAQSAATRVSRAIYERGQKFHDMWMAELVQDLSFSGSTLCRSGITTAANHLQSHALQDRQLSSAAVLHQQSLTEAATAYRAHLDIVRQ